MKRWSEAGDPFSDVLQLIEARSVISGGLRAGGTWALRFPPPGAIKFAVVIRGSGWLHVDGQRRPVKLEQGDVVLLPGRRGFVFGSSPAALSASPKDALRVLAHGGGALAQLGDGSACTALAGGVALHPSAEALLTHALPALVLVRAAPPRTDAIRWIMEQLLEERSSTLPGASLVAAQLAQLLFVQILRAYLATSARLPVGWLRGVRDARLAPTLRLMHGDPSRDWKLGELARAAAMSRTGFAVRFREVVGVSPMAYLTAWRMRLAQRALREGYAPVSEIAASLGYGSESAFSQAFKRVTGMRPRDYRNAERPSAPEGTIATVS